MPVSVGVLDIWDQLHTNLLVANGDAVTYTYDLTAANTFKGLPDPKRFPELPSDPAVYIFPPRGTSDAGPGEANLVQYGRTWTFPILGFVRKIGTSYDRIVEAFRLLNDIHTALEADRGVSGLVIDLTLQQHDVDDAELLVVEGRGLCFLEAVVTVQNVTGV